MRGEGPEDRRARRLDATRVPCYTNLVANLTIVVDDEVLKRARIRALEQGTSVNAVLAARLQAYAGEIETQTRATQALIALARSLRRPNARKLRERRRFTRDELHER